MVFRLNSQIFEYAVGPEALHVIPVLYLAMSDGIVYTVACAMLAGFMFSLAVMLCLPGPEDAASASSPIKKSKSSVPLFPDRCPPGPAPPVRNDGLFATAGLPDPEPPAPAAGPFVAMAVGKTKEGESLPANPSLEYPVPLFPASVLFQHV